MATRRDQLQSYQFLTQRVISAFVMRETDPAMSPLRRGVGAVFAGLMVAVLVGAGFGVYGLLSAQGANGWRQENAVVVEKETGASYVYRSGLLHPALNYTSAVLAGGQGVTSVYRVPAASLAGVPRGDTIGIPGAPNSLPGRGSLVRGPWSLCTVPAGGTDTDTVLLVDTRPTGAQDLGDKGLLVVDTTTRDQYLVYNQRRFPIRDPAFVNQILFGGARPVPVGPAWLNAVDRGAEISEPQPARPGTVSTALPAYRNGQVLVERTATFNQYFLVYDDGLAQLTSLQYQLVSGRTTDTTPITPAAVTAARRSTRLATPDAKVAPPDSPPSLGQPKNQTDPACLQTSGDTAPGGSAGTVSVLVGGHMPADHGLNTTARSPAGTPYADRIVVPAGHAAVVRAMASPSATAGGLSIVTDQGLRFPVPDAQTLGLLGYSTSLSVNMPSEFVLRIPVGPTLDPVAAAAAATIGG